MNSTRIAVCGGNREIRLNLIRSLTSAGTVPENPPADLNMIYETENVDYIDCNIPAREYADFIAKLNMDFRLNFNPEDSDKPDIIWYCIDGKTGVDELGMLAKFRGRVLFAITDGDDLNGDKLRERTEALENTGFDRRSLVFVSLENKSGLVLLIEKSIRLLGGSLTVPSEELAILKTRISTMADSYLYWAAGRAFAIALVPLPMADITPLVMNEAYMFYKLGQIYGYAVDKTVWAGFLGCLGASVGGKIAVSFVPFLKAPIAAGITYAVGCAAKAYFESDMTLERNELKDIFRNAKAKGEKMDWRESR